MTHLRINLKTISVNLGPDVYCTRMSVVSVYCLYAYWSWFFKMFTNPYLWGGAKSPEADDRLWK